MDYLFFDIESAHGNFSKGAMCSFGYVLCNDNYDILEQDDILINPELEKWDWYVVKNILPYSKDVYNSMSSFPKSYERIKTLLTRPNTMIINHGIENDVFITSSTIRRYKLEQFDYHFYDTALFYKKYRNTKGTLSLDKVSEEVCFEEPRTTHPSLEDAKRVYRIMMTIAIEKEKTIKELFDEYTFCDGEVVNGKAIFNRPKPIIDFKTNKYTRSYKDFYRTFIIKHDINSESDSRFNGKTYSIDTNYLENNFAESLYIVEKMSSFGAKYQFKASESDIFIEKPIKKWDGSLAHSIMAGYVQQAIDNGKEVEVINVDDFLKEINYSKEDLKAFIDSLEKRKSNCIFIR